MVQRHLGEEEIECKVVHYWEIGTGWKWELPQDKLSFENMVKLASVILQEDGSRVDRVEWSLGGRWLFTVKTSYKLVRGHSAGQVWEGWSSIRRLKMQKRIHVFAWIMAHKKLLTNLERWKQRLTSCSMCTRYSLEEESTLHVLRDIIVA